MGYANNTEEDAIELNETQSYVCETLALNTEDLKEQDIWIADSGVSMHMT